MSIRSRVIGAFVSAVLLLLIAFLFSLPSYRLLAQDPGLTPTPASGVGVPFTNSGWRITLDAEITDSIRRTTYAFANGSLHVSVQTTSAPSGKTFLVVNPTFTTLGGINTRPISSSDVYLTDEQNRRYSPDELSNPPGEFDFLIPNDFTQGTFTFHFRDVEPFAFSAANINPIEYDTVIGADEGNLPSTCDLLTLPQNASGQLVTLGAGVEAFSIGYIGGDNFDAHTACDDVAFGTLTFAGDGAALLHLWPALGWESLYLIEDQKVIPLVHNGIGITADFGPTGQWVYFTAGSIGKAETELYVYQRDTDTLNLLQHGKSVSFQILTDGRLVTDFQETSDDDRQLYIGSPDGSDLAVVDTFEDVSSNRQLTNTGRRLIYVKYNPSSDFSTVSQELIISDFNGRNARTLADTSGSLTRLEVGLDYQLAPNDKSILIDIAREPSPGQAIVRRLVWINLATFEQTEILSGYDNAVFNFSIDSRTAYIRVTTNGQNKLLILDAKEGTVLNELDDTLNAFFSPDGTSIAYTKQADSGLEIHVFSLSDEADSLAGSGLLTGWYPHILPPPEPCSVGSSTVVNLRSGPGTSYDRAGTLAGGTPIEAIGQMTGEDGFVWWQLVDNRWVRSDVVNEEGGCETLPQASAP
ncbi:MAG: hypothetical protein H6672_06990 [Anaerolineaceae bacterium]|nr:hypothetical protein [Anaerolineaceae bacterium]